jgi:hypothetical protein
MDVIETDTADVQVNSAGATSYVNNYKIMNMLGEGTFSKVYLCQNDAGSDFVSASVIYHGAKLQCSLCVSSLLHRR